MFTTYKLFLAQESYPNNPNELVIRNRFYFSGLTEEDIYNYYMENKDQILKQTKDREVLFVVFIDTNQPIVRRRGRGNNFIYLTKDNYEEVITGRTVSLHNTMGSRENIGIVDIDYHDFNTCKEVTAEVYKFLNKYYRNVDIRFTGKSSFHVAVEFKMAKDVDEIREELTKLLYNQFFDKYLINATRSQRTPNLDLSPNKKRGAFIFPGSLSTMGLRCMSINLNQLSSFRREQAKIK